MYHFILRKKRVTKIIKETFGILVAVAMVAEFLTLVWFTGGPSSLSPCLPLLEVLQHSEGLLKPLWITGGGFINEKPENSEITGRGKWCSGLWASSVLPHHHFHHHPLSPTGFESSVLNIPSIGTCQENFSARLPTFNSPSWSCRWVLENLGKQDLIDSLIKHNKKRFWLVYMIIVQWCW